MIVSKKTLPKAADRHRLKRRIFAILGALPLSGSVVVYPRASALSLPVRDLRSELSTLLSQIHT